MILTRSPLLLIPARQQLRLGRCPLQRPLVNCKSLLRSSSSSSGSAGLLQNLSLLRSSSSSGATGLFHSLSLLRSSSSGAAGLALLLRVAVIVAVSRLGSSNSGRRVVTPVAVLRVHLRRRLKRPPRLLLRPLLLVVLALELPLTAVLMTRVLLPLLLLMARALAVIVAMPRVTLTILIRSPPSTCLMRTSSASQTTTMTTAS